MNAVDMSNAGGGHSAYRREDIVSLRQRSHDTCPDESLVPESLVGTWVEKIHWDMQRALLMGEDEETTGVVKLEIPEL